MHLRNIVNRRLQLHPIMNILHEELDKKFAILSKESAGMSAKLFGSMATMMRHAQHSDKKAKTEIKDCKEDSCKHFNR